MNPNSIIPQSDDRLLSYFVKEAATGLFSKDKNGGENDDNYFFVILGLLMVVATEPYKVLLRKNIGKLSLSLARLAVAAFLYLYIALMMFAFSYETQLNKASTALMAGSVFYVLFAIALLFLGFAEYTKAKQKYASNEADTIANLYRGDSIFFKGADQKKIWLKKEPVVCFIISLLLTVLPIFIHPLLFVIGAPLLATSISFWFNEWYQINNVWDVQTKRILKEQMKNSQSQAGFETDEYNQVSTDV